MGASTASARVSAFASAYAPLLVREAFILQVDVLLKSEKDCGSTVDLE